MFLREKARMRKEIAESARRVIDKLGFLLQIEAHKDGRNIYYKKRN